MNFQLYGRKNQGLCTVEALNKKGSIKLNLIAIDVLTDDNLTEPILVYGEEDRLYIKDQLSGFINFKKTAPTKEQIELWKEAFGDWPVNKKGPTYRKIKDDFESLPPSKKIKLLIETTSAIKRPILMKANTVKHFGYDEDFYDSIK